jgi:hypothetical protein
LQELKRSHPFKSSFHKDKLAENQESKEMLRNSNEVINRTESYTTEPRQRVHRFTTLEKLLNGNV